METTVDVFKVGQEVIWDTGEYRFVDCWFKPIYKRGKVVEVKEDTLIVRTGIIRKEEVDKIECGILR